MCMSPDEMTSARIEQHIEWIQREVNRAGEGSYWAFRLQGLKDILKERAENGTYATAGIE